MLEDDLEVPLFNPPSQRVRRPPRSGPPEGGAAHRRRGPRRLRTPAAPARRAASSRSRRSSGSGSCPGSERFAAHLDAVEVALGKLEGLGRPTVHEPPMPLERVSRAQAGHPDPRQPLGLPRMSRNAPGSDRASRGRAKWLSRVRRQLSRSVREQRVGDRGQLALHRPVDEPRRPPPRRLALLGRAPVPPSYHRQGGGVMGRQPPRFLSLDEVGLQVRQHRFELVPCIRSSHSGASVRRIASLRSVACTGHPEARRTGSGRQRARGSSGCRREGREV